MSKKATRKAAVVFGTTGAIALSALFTAPPAGAINRVDCTAPGSGSALELLSNLPTCWANPGNAGVSLLGVTSYSSFGWAGCFNTDHESVGFLKGANSSWGGVKKKVVFIHIDTGNNGSTAPCRV